MGCFGCLRPDSRDNAPMRKADAVEPPPRPKVVPDAASDPSTPTTSSSTVKPLLHSSGSKEEREAQSERREGDGSRSAAAAEAAPMAAAEPSAGEAAAAAASPLRTPSASTPISAQTFTFEELRRATGNFSDANFIGEGGFGRVYKGRLASTGQVVAVKQLDRNGLQGNREFLVEVLMLSLLHHPNLVNLIGYCADGDQRLLVYEFMPLGALEDHLHDLPEGKPPLEWNTRMRVAAGAAKGLEYLHVRANPPVIYRDFKSSNILLEEGFHPKLSDFGLAKLGPTGEQTHVSTRVMGTYGYCAPEYAMTGQLTLKSDVYSFGVVLLELITGRKAIDNARGEGEHNLVAWARPMFKDRRKFPAMADPRLQGRFPMRGLYQALAVAAMCLQEAAATRPMIVDVVTALNYLAAQQYDPHAQSLHRMPMSERERKERERRSGTRTPRILHGAAGSPRYSPVRQRSLEPDAERDGGGGPGLSYRESVTPRRPPGRMAALPPGGGGVARMADRPWGGEQQHGQGGSLAAGGR